MRRLSYSVGEWKSSLLRATWAKETWIRCARGTEQRVRAQQKEWSSWKIFQFIWTGRSCCLFLRVWFRLGSLCKPECLKVIFCLFKIKYFQRLNWNFFTYFRRWGEFFFSKHTKFNSVWKMAHIGNLYISETFQFLYLVVVYINLISCFQWEHLIRGLCDNQERNCMGLFLHVLKIAQGTKDTLTTRALAIP